MQYDIEISPSYCAVVRIYHNQWKWLTIRCALISIERMQRCCWTNSPYVGIAICLNNSVKWGSNNNMSYLLFRSNTLQLLFYFDFIFIHGTVSCWTSIVSWYVYIIGVCLNSNVLLHACHESPILLAVSKLNTLQTMAMTALRWLWLNAWDGVVCVDPGQIARTFVLVITKNTSK